MNYRDIITIEPGKRGGKPCIRGLRITVSDVLDWLAAGMTENEMLADHPDLERDDIRACLAFAADRERRLAALSVCQVERLLSRSGRGYEALLREAELSAKLARGYGESRKRRGSAIAAGRPLLIAP